MKDDLLEIVNGMLQIINWLFRLLFVVFGVIIGPIIVFIYVVQNERLESFLKNFKDYYLGYIPHLWKNGLS